MSTYLRIIALIWCAIWAVFLRNSLWGMRVNASLWGIVWALCLQRTQWGRWLALHRTWITVVIGVGVNLILLFFVLPRKVWFVVSEVFALSSIGIILRSLINEYLVDVS